MKLITRTRKAEIAARDWYNVYNGDNRLGWRFGDDKPIIYENLVALGENPSPDDVDSVIGNTSWTDCICNECNKRAEEVMMLGQKPDYDSSTAYICLSCLKKAVRLME